MDAIRECAKEKFGVNLSSIVLSQPGQSGQVTGTGPDQVRNGGNNAQFTVVNNVERFTASDLQSLNPSGKPTEGLTATGWVLGAGGIHHFTPYENYTASDLTTSTDFLINQVHELGHSLAAITGAAVPTPIQDRDVGDWFYTCVDQKLRTGRRR